MLVRMKGDNHIYRNVDRVKNIGRGIAKIIWDKHTELDVKWKEIDEIIHN